MSIDFQKPIEWSCRDTINRRGKSMLNLDCIKTMLGMKDVMVKQVKKTSIGIEIHIEMEVKSHTCPQCNEITGHIHDYRCQRVRDLPAFGESVVLILRKRRYRCGHCGKCFSEKNSFVSRYQRMTHRFRFTILDKLREVCSFSSVAREWKLSVSSVIRIFDLVSYPKPRLPVVLAMDEFKGNTGRDKYQVILTDPVSRKVLDILPSRYQHKLVDYFKSSDRNNTKHVVSDMSGAFAEVYRAMFSQASHAVDKYHVVRQVMWAFEAVRKEEQKRFSQSHRKYFKRSKALLIKHFVALSDEAKQQVNIMLYASPNLSSAHFLKEQFQQLLQIKEYSAFKTNFKKWILNAQDSHLLKFKECAGTFSRWYKEILYAFKTGYTNGFTEGCNNKIKVLKRNAYGYRNFERFRNRILHIFSNK